MRLAYALIPFALTAALTVPAMAQTATSPDRIISMQGHGEATAAPDMASIDTGVTTQAPTARAALDANTTAMNALIATLKSAGIADRDIQTANFSVNPNYVYPQPDANGNAAPPSIQGYNVSNTVTIKVRDLTKLGDILDKVVTAGSNTINGISFSVADPSALYDEARKAAFADAQHKAELFAGVASLGLGDIVTIAENQGYNIPVPTFDKRAMVAQSAPVPVQAGELTFALDVTVAWELETKAQ